MGQEWKPTNVIKIKNVFHDWDGMVKFAWERPHVASL